MTLPEIDSFVPRRFLQAAQVFSLSRKDRQISSQTSRQLGHEHARQSNERCVCVTRSIQPENITPAIGSRLEKKIDFVRTKKKQSRVHGSDPFHCMSSLPTECLAKTNSLLGRWGWHGRHVKSI